MDARKSRNSITIAKEPEEVFTFWRNFGNLALVMKGFARIEVHSKTKSHWVARMESGRQTEWDAEITREIDGRLISWKSTEGSHVRSEGTVEFERAPAGRGTVVRLTMDGSVPRAEDADQADQIVQTDLKRLKAYLETGEIPTVEGQSSGRSGE
jgi:uncharacterized membrane protein